MKRAATTNGSGSVAASVWVRLLRAHGLILREARRRVPHGLTLPQFDVLAQLHRHPEGMTQGALGDELLVTSGNLTGIVRRLVQLGLVERRRARDDRRALQLRLSVRGRALMGRALPQHRNQLATLMARVPSTDLARLRDLLGVLASHVGQESEGA